MNKIFKVIWSKSKQCYIVVSEIAKNKTGKKKIVVAGIFAALAMVNGVQDGQAINGSGARTGWNSNGVGFHPTQGLVVGPNMNDNTTIANGNVATVAIGAHSQAAGSSSVAIGGAEVNGAGAVGLGWATAKGDNSVALGGTGSTNANGNNAFAASGGNATGESATAIGSSAIADGRGGVAVGWNAESKVNAVGIGFNAKAKANNTVAIGVEANNDKANVISNNYSSVSVGVATRARAVGSMAMGVSADASGKYSIALGSGNVSGDYTATANYPKATGEKAIAIGYDGQALNINATAVGSEAHAIGKQSAAYGFKSQASEQDATAIGSNAIASAVRTTALGVNAQALGSNSVAIGGGAGGTGTAGFAEELNADGGDINRLNRNINTATTAEGDNAVALGYYANAANGGVAIGQTSVAATGGVALGQRVLEDTGNKYASAVVIGQDSTAKGTYSVSIGRQTITKGSTSLAMGNGASANGGYSVAMGRKVVADDTSTAIGHHAYASKGGLAIGAQDNDTSADRTTASAKGALAIGKNTKASAEDAVAIGTNAQSTLKGAVALGSGSTTATIATKQTSTTVNGIAYNFAGATSDPNMQVSVGAAGKERQIKNVAAGEVSATSTDAINGSQLFAVASQIKPINYVSVKSSAVGNKNNDGATGNDAVAIGPGAQSSGDNGVSLGNGSQANAESVVSIGYQSNYGAQNNPKSIGIGWAAGFQSNGTENIGIGTDAGRKLTGSNNVSIGKSAGLGDVYSSGSVLLGQSATIVNSTDKAAINDVVAIGNGAQGGAASSVAIGKGAKALGFSTIAIGENSNAKVKIGSAPSVAIGRNTTANGDYAVALGGGDNSGQFQGAKAAGVGTTAIGSATVTKDDTNFQTAVGFGAKTDATNASAFGYNASATANNATALGYAASATAENATALGTGAIAKIKDGVAIGSGSKATVDKGVKGYDPNDGRTNKYGGLTNNILTSTNAAVSVGEGASVTRQITGVAAGTSNTDAVNVAQLKSVNLAFSGNSGNNDVNLANGTLAIKGDTTYITTTANTNGITIAGKTQDISVNANGVASANKGMADAKNVAQSINDAISKNAYTWTVSANGDAGESVAKSNKVDFNGDSSNITVERAGKKITTKLNKDITVDSVKANNKVTVGTAAKQLVLDGTTGAMTAGIGANAIKLDGTSATITAGSGNNAISLNGTNAQAAFGSGTNAVSINGKTGAVTGQIFTAGNTIINTTGLTSSTGSRTVSFGTNGISAGDQVISNVRTGGNTNSNAANIGDVKRYVSGATLNLTDGANHKGSVQLGDQSLKVSSGTGINATVSGQTVNIGLTTDAQNAISNGIGLLGNVGNTGIKQLKDGNATFDIKGDGSVVKTTASNSGVTIAVDTDKLAANTNLAYTANGASTAKNVALSKGLNFVNGSNTIAIVNDDGKVSFDLNAATKTQINTNTTGVAANKTNIATNAADIATNKNKIATNTTDIAANKSKIATNTTNIAANTTALARSISLGADSGAKSSQSLSTGDVAFNIKGATGDYISTKMNGNTVEVSTKRSTINSDANSGAASVTGADGLATAKNVASAINSAVNGLSQNLNISDGTKDSSVALKSQKLTVTGTGAATTAVNNQTITVDVAEGTLSNNADGTVKADAAGVATTKNVADVINKTISDNQYSWKLSANGEATTATVGKGDTVDFTGDTNITVDRNNKDISVKLNKNLTDMNSISLGNARGETIVLNGGDGSIKAGKAEFKDNVGAGSTITSDQLKFTNGATGANEATTTIALDTVAIQSGPNSSVLTSKYLTFSDEDGNNAEGSAKGMAFQNAAGKLVQFTVDEIKAGGNKIQEVAEGTADTDAVNVKQLKDTIGGQSLTYRANTSADTDAKSVKLSKGLDFVNGTSTVASVDEDGKVSFDLNTATKTQINTNTTDIATNTANIAHTIALADDKGASTTAKSLKDGNVSFNIKGDNKFISTAASGNDVTLTVNEQAIKDAAKSASSFKVKANTHAEEEVKGGDTITFNNGDNIAISQTGKTFTIGTAKNITVDSVTAGNTVINTSGLTNGTTAITGTGITTDKVTVGGISIDKTAGINAGGKVISNVASGTVNNNATDDSNAANIGDVKQAVANLSQNLNITDGTNNGTVDIKNQKLNVAGANGVTATVNNQTITVGLDANTVNATTKGIGLTADTGSTGNKYLKDGDVSFAVTGDGNLVSTSATAAGVKVAVDAAKVKDLAVAAVTVSKDTQADNPITVTPTAGTNSKDYAIGIDTTKLAAKTDLTYRANSAADANAKKVSLSKGLNFVDGDSTVATVDNDGKVSFDLNTATKNQINTNTTDIATNKGKIATNTTNIAANTTALARHISLGADTGTSSSQSLSAADVAFNVKGATGDFVSTNMNGNTVEISTKRATINSNATTGEASVTGNDGLATAQNVADAINKAADAAKAGAAWNITTNSSTTDKTAVKGGDTVDLVNGDNIEITQDGTDKKKITVATKKDITVDSVTANNKVTVGSGANKITLDGTDGSVTGKAFTGTTFTGTSFTGTSFTAGNTVINTNGLTNGTTAITGTGVTTDNVTVGGISIDKTAGINAGNKVISNVASGGTTLTNAANIGDVQNAVANLSQNLNITDGTHDGTVNLKNQKLNVAGANGVTATVNNQTITVGLDANTVNATTKGIGLTADTGSTGNKYLKDGDVSFAVTGDGSLVSTSATAAGVKVAVDAAKVKDLAVDAVTVSKDAQADNPITVTPTAGTNSKDYAIGIDTTKLAGKTDLTYRANNDIDANAKKVSLAKGLNFVNGTLTTASIDNDGVVKYDVNTAAITAGTDGTVTGPTTDGVATAQNVADAINAAKKASKTEITANTGEAANATTGNVTLTSTTAADGHTIYDLKLNDKVTLGTGANAVTIDGTAGKATIGSSVVDGVNNTITTGGVSPVTLDGATGTITGKTANIGGVTVNGTTNDITGLSNTTVTGADFATKGRAATEEQLKVVTSATALKFTGDVATNTGSINLKDDTFGIKGDGKYITTDVNGKDVNLTVSEAEVKKSAVAAVTVSTDTTDANNPISVTPTTSADGTTKDYKVTIDGTKIANKTNLSYKANDGTAKQVSLADGLNFKNGTLTTASINDAGVVKYDVNTAAITAGTDGTVTGPTTDGVATAQNVADAINAVKKASKTEITANTGEAANATTGNVTLTSTVAADGHTIYDVKLNDKVTLGTGANAVTIDGTAGKITAKSAAIGGVTVDGDNSHVTGLSNTTWNGTATTGRAATEDQLKAVADTAKATTDAVNLKFSGDTNTSAGVVNLKDDTFNIVGDGKYVTTDANGKDLTVKVSEAEVKKSAVSAVTVSTDTTDANNPISVTPTTSADGTTKDYKVTIDGTKIANKTNLSYKANDGTAKQVSLADGLNFKNGILTTASIDDAGVVKYDVNTAAITAGTDGTITGPTTDGVATAQNVADAINAAKKASKTEITANTGEAANATTGNVTLTSTTAADGHTIYDVKLNDKVTLGTGANAVTIDGTAGKATVGTAVVDGVNNTITTGGANAVTLDGATAKVTAGVITVDGVTGTITTGGTNSVKIDGATGTVTGLTNKDWTPGVTKAVTGRAATEDQLQKVADAASSQTWNITADKAGTTGAQTGTKKNATVGKDETVELVAGDNLTINQDERKFTYSLNKDLAGLTSVSIGTGTTETIKLDGATGKITAKNAVIGGVTVDGDNSHVTGLSNTTWNGTATTGRAATEDQLKAVADTAKATTDAVNLKFSGDTNTSAGVVNLKDDTFNIVGDGKYVTTDANGKDLTVKVSEAEVKKSAVSAVTVSTDTTDANNPISVTPTTSADGTTKDYKVTIDGTKIANKTNLSYKANDGTAKQVSLADGLNFKDGTLTTASIDDAGVVKYDVNTATITAGTDGTITGPTTDGVATAQNVADAINAAKKASKTEITANTGEAANATTGNVTLTSTTAADGHTIYDVKLNDKVTLGTGANAVTIDGTAGKATIGSSVVDGVNNTITTGGANAVVLNGADGTVKTGTVTLTGGTTNDITGLSNTTVNSADFATKGRAATEEQLKAVGEQTWQITADKDAATSGAQTGTKKDAKVGKDDKVQLIAGENLTVNQNERDFTYSLNKDLVKMNSATFEATGGKTTVIKGDSIAQTDGTKTNTSTAAGNTVADGGKSTATTADGVRINTTAKNPVSLTDAGLDNGNNVIKNVASGHVNNDDTDNTNAANIADVKKATTTVTANNGETANTTTGNVTLTSTTAADGHIIYDVKLNDKVTLGTGSNAVTIDGTAGKATIGSSVVDGVNNTITTGGANAVTMDGAAGTVKTGTVTVAGGTTNDITGLSNTTVNSADFATKGRAATEEQLKAVGEQTWQITADKDTTTSGNQTGTKKDAKVGKDDKVQLIAGENLTVNQNERDFTYSLNKDLVKMNSATFEATGGKTTVITGDSIAQTDGTKTNRSTAAGNTVADGTKSTETTAAGQVIKDGAKSNKSTVDSNVIDDGNGNVNTSNATSNTIANGADSTATTAAGTTVTSANGNTNYTADGVRINTTGKNPVSLTDAGLDNGNNVIKNVASGHVNNDDTDNTNAANIADVKKATTTVTANNGEAANATTGNVTLTSTTAADGHTIYDVKLNDKVTLGTGANAVTIDGTAGKATVGTAVVDGVNNTITTGGANAVKLDGAAGTVKTGTVTVTGGTTNDITGLSNTTVNSADFATKGRAATEEQLKAVGEQTWQITADKDATTSGAQTGTKKDAKVGKDDKVQLIAGENLTVNQNERDFTYSLNKDLVKMNSATFEATGSKTTIITGDRITQTDGTKTNTSTAAGNTVADGTKSTETTAAGQVIKDGAKTNTSTVDENTLVDGAKSNKTTVDSNVIDDGNGNVNTSNATSNTIANGADSTATTAAGTTVTSANGNTNYTADGVRINTTGKNPVSLTDAGLDNGNNVIKNVASGHVNNDDTDNTNAANIADVKKATTTVTANNGEAANATTGNVTLTSTTAADGHTIYDVKLNDKVTLGTGANAVTIDGTAGKATVGTAVVDGVNNTITTGGANAVKLDGAAGTVKTGTVTVTGGTTNDITGLSNTTVNSADFATKGRAATEEQLKAVGEQTWQITADKDATTSGAQTGTKKDAKVGKDDKVQLIAGENLTVNQNERDFTYSLNKDLVKMNSATFEATGSKTTIITGDRITQTDGTKTNTSTAAGNTVADGTKSTETTAAGQVIKDGAKTNTSTVDENTLVDGAKSNKTTVDSNVIDDSNGNVNTSNATSNTITDGTNTSTVTAGKAQIGTVGIDGVASKITTGGANAVVINGADGTVKTGTVTLTGGTTNDITGLSNTTVNSADFATKGRAATEEQLKQVGEQTWQITADKDATTSGAQTGTKKDAKVGKDDKVQLIAGENLTVNQNERDFTYSLNKDLVKMNSATFEATGGKTTVITGDSIAQTDGAKTNTSTAAGNTVADGTKSTETTAAGQVIKDGAKTNTSTVDENALVDGAKSNKTTVDSNVIDDGNGNVNTSKATSNTITDGTNTTEATASTVTVKDNAGNSTVITKDTITTGTGANKVTVDGTVGKVTAGSAVVDGVNNTITTGGANTVKLDGAAGTVTGLTNTAWTPGVTKAVSGRAATEDQLQQVSDAVGAGWNINSGTVTGSTGEANGSTKTKISSGEEVQLQAGNNLIIDQHGKTLAYSLNKNLKDMESAIFNATGGKTTVIKGDSIVQTDGGKTNTSNAAGNTVVDGTKSTATTAAGTTITDGAKTNTNTADKNVIDDGAGNTNTSNATSNTIADSNGNTNTATATSNTLADNAGNSNVSNATSNNLTDNAGNSNVSNATSNTLKNAAGDETKVDAKGATVKDAAGNTTNIASTGATVTNAAGDTTKVEATGTTVADAAGNKATFTKDGVTIIKPGKDTVSLTGNGLDNGNNKIVNVADGTNDTDAVNVRQLDAKTKAARTELTANGGESADNTTGNIVLTKTTAPDGHIIYDNKLNDKIILGAADPTKAVTVDGTNGTIKAGKDGNAVAINGTDGTIKAGDGTNAVAIDGVNGSVKVADKIALNGKDGKATIGTVGIDGKDGIITTGGNNPVAVNGKDGVVTGLTNKTWDPNNITSGRAATEDQVQSAVANAGWDATVGTEGSGVNSTPSATPEKIRPNETLTFKAGNNMMVSQNGKIISYAVNPELTDMKSATFKDAAGNTTVTNGNGMTITPGSANPNNPNAGPVSLTKDGLNNGNNQIKGVTPGTDPTDVVNVSQLNASNANTSQAINQIAGEVQRVGAHAAAMAALKPIQYDPLEPTQVMAGVGNYRGETAAALGLAHYTNENTMFNVGVSVGGNHNMVNAGVTHKFGYSPEKKNIPDRYKAGPISSVYVMQDEVSSLKKENAEQKYVIADQAARLNTLEAENERQRQELAETKQGLDDLRAAVDKLLASKG